MPESTIDELTRADEAFAGNRLLSTFSREARALIEPFGELVELNAGDVVLQKGDSVKASLFPVDSTIVSMAVELSGASNVLFRRNSTTGAVEAVPWRGEGIALNADLHAN